MQTDAMIALSALVLGIAISALVASQRGEADKRTRPWLSAICLLFAAIAAIPLVIAFATPLYVFYMPAVLPMVLTLPVVLHTYASRLASGSDGCSFRARDAVLPGAGVLVTFGYWSLAQSEKTTMFVDGDLPSGILPAALALITVGLIVSGSIVSLVYLVATTRQLGRYRERLKALYSNTERYELRWVDGLLIVLVALWTTTAFSLVTDNIGIGLLFRGEVIYLLAAAALLMLSLYGSPREPAPETQAMPSADDVSTDEKYARSALTSDRSNQIAKRIEQTMREDKLYLDANLSLQKLSQHVRTPQNLVSQTLNETLGTTFFDYVAHWRIEAAKPLIEAGEQSVLTIALDVGFNSRSTFYKAFKRETSMAPKAYRESLRPLSKTA